MKSSFKPTFGGTRAPVRLTPVSAVKAPQLGGGFGDKSSPEPITRTAAPSAHRKDLQGMLDGYTKEKQGDVDAEFKSTLESFGIKIPDDVNASLGGVAQKRLSDRLKAAQSSRASLFASGKEGIFGTTTQQECPSPVHQDGSPLKMSANGFQVKALDQMDAMERFIRSTNRILNKLTPEKYDTLAPLLLEDSLGLMTHEDYMEQAITLIFDRAIVQPAFVEMYAQLAQYLQREETEMLRREGDPSAKGKFRRKLIQVVQKKYEDMSNYDPARHADNAELDAAEKKKKLGNVRFVGELFNKQVINEKIIDKLLARTLYGMDAADDAWRLQSKDIKFRPRPDQIEDLCKLIITAGKVFEEKQHQAKQTEKVNMYFKHMTFLASDDFYKPRIRIGLVNTIDIRRAGYPIKEDQAVKLQELEVRAERAAMQKKEGWTQANDVVDVLQGMRTKESKAKDKKKQKQQQHDDSGWQTAGKGKAAAGGKRGSAQPVVTGGGAYDSFKSKSKEKTKADKKAEKKKEEKKKKDTKKKEEEKKESRIPPQLHDDLRHKMKGRAEECALECPEEEYEEQFQTDFNFFEEQGVEDVPPTVVMEILRVIGMTNKAELQEAMKKYLVIMSERICKKSDFVRGIAWFYTHTSVMRVMEDSPNIYKRVAPIVAELLPAATGYADLTKVFQQTFRGIADWWQVLDEDAKMSVESMDELHEEIIDRAWKPMNKGADLEGQFDEAAQHLALSSLLTLNSKANWPVMPFGGDKVFLVMIQHLLENKVIEQSSLNRWYAKQSKKDGEKQKEKTQIALQLLEAKGLIEEAEAEDAVEDEEAEEVEEEEEADADAA